jgi:formate C-acetyltransferase
MPEQPCEELFELAAFYLRDGGNRCQILNDRKIIGALEKKEVPHDDAVMYMCGGCMEISSQGTNGDMLFTQFFNTPKVLELMMNGGVCLNTGRKILKNIDKTLADYSSFEEFYTAFLNELTRILHLWFRRIDMCVKLRAELKPSFFISSQIENCIARGRGINDGGAKYEDYGATPLAIPNLGDSLFCLKRAVYDEAFVSADELLAALRNNFADDEALRMRLLNLPKFGQGHNEADAMVDRVLGDVCDAFDSYTNVLGGRVRPMIMTFNTAASAGAALGATPDGRKAGTPIAQGLSPQSSSMTQGLSTALRSANSLDLSRLWGGTTSMWDIDRKFASRDNLKTIIKTFLQQGGHIYQGNTTDVDELKRAQKEPEKYPHLIVRIGGYSGRFVTLNESLQNEIIGRYRHSA